VRIPRYLRAAAADEEIEVGSEMRLLNVLRV
jgi:hypothetical protein